ncbi:uncharacterized protein A4U43_C03F23810 [Asparagus officinalis]|uniref:Uncharacterized protein n=1 Tax=Asparagus officinalis TaxID=4686 RepID=A0A5P1FDF7_ASPOF|nr:uncharacterized protein A4U43_C03F23810 [Asparagus officinalis]
MSRVRACERSVRARGRTGRRSGFKPLLLSQSGSANLSWAEEVDLESSLSSVQRKCLGDLNSNLISDQINASLVSDDKISSDKNPIVSDPATETKKKASDISSNKLNDSLISVIKENSAKTNDESLSSYSSPSRSQSLTLPIPSPPTAPLRADRTNSTTPPPSAARRALRLAPSTLRPPPSTPPPPPSPIRLLHHDASKAVHGESVSVEPTFLFPNPNLRRAYIARQAWKLTS